MFKRIALVAAVLLAACGTEKAPQAGDGNPADPGTGGGGSVPVASLQANTSTVKVVLKTARAVYTPITRYDGALDDFFPVTCTPATEATDCADYPGAVCQNNQCALITYVPAIFYVRNFTVPATGFSVPCDGRTYTAEVYGGSAGVTAGTFDITEAHVSAPFIMPAGCAAPALSWTSALPAGVSTLLPSYTFPPIYVGLGAPFNTFSVAVSGLRYPWSGADWTLTYAGPPVVSPTTYAGGIATFAVPATIDPITFTGLFRLDWSLLLAGESNTSWTVTRVSAPQTPVQAGPVDLP